MQRLSVAVAADDRYLPHCAAMLWSIAESQADAEIGVELLCPTDISQPRVDAVRAMLEPTSVSLNVHRIAADRIEGLPAWGRIPTTMWYRVLLPELVPDADRILYLDVDVIVLDRLAPLWSIDLAGAYVGAVTNVPERHRMSHATELGLTGPQAYFNSGVLLLNLAAMRADGVAAQLVQCARERAGRLLWPDQDALNIVLGDRRVALEPRWNVMNSMMQFSWAEDVLERAAIERALARPAIVHFEGPAANKPWHLLCPNPHRHRYREARRHTPWPRYWPAGATPVNLVRRLGRGIRDRLRA